MNARYDEVTEKPLRHFAYKLRVIRHHNELRVPDVDPEAGARDIACLPGGRKAFLEFPRRDARDDYSPPGRLVVEAFGETVKASDLFGYSDWLVLRFGDSPHPLDAILQHHNGYLGDHSGRVMFYTDDEFRARYNVDGDL